MPSKQLSLEEAIQRFVPDGASVAIGMALESLIPFAAGHELIRQRRRALELIGPISDMLFDQLIGAGCVRRVTAAWVGNVSAGHGHCWGNFGLTREAGMAAERVILVAEEIVRPDVILSDPNRILLPPHRVAAVVHAVGGAHPSPVQGYYGRDHAQFGEYHRA